MQLKVSVGGIEEVFQIKIRIISCAECFFRPEELSWSKLELRRLASTLLTGNCFPLLSFPLPASCHHFKVQDVP